jgi:hypothetical protein
MAEMIVWNGYQEYVAWWHVVQAKEGLGVDMDDEIVQVDFVL